MSTPAVPGPGLVPSKSSGTTTVSGLEPDADDVGPPFKAGEPSVVSLGEPRETMAGPSGRRPPVPEVEIHRADGSTSCC